jgi:hypothetical protein
LTAPSHEFPIKINVKIGQKGERFLIHNYLWIKKYLMKSKYAANPDND